jgi:aryl-alcohol dehydrogenase-like predicted oxidoreductase
MGSRTARARAVEELLPIAADAGLSLTHLALAFAVAHPGVTSAIIGPRTMDQLTDLLAGAPVEADTAYVTAHQKRPLCRGCGR